jgi:hypothetical protein
MTPLVYSPCSIKRVRRTKAEIEAVREAIYEVLATDNPMTVRQCFYALTVRGVIEKTEPEYNGTVARLLMLVRRDGVIRYSWISDNTRWIRKPTTYRGVGQFLHQAARLYRRDLWDEAAVSIEIWCEKDALASVIIEGTEPYDVPLMLSRGFSSDTYLQSVGEEIQDRNKPTFIYQFGDHDPSGIWITKQIERGLRHHGPNAEIYFERGAVTPEQIAAWSLPSRPTKREGNTHARGSVGDSVELDAIPASRLRKLVRQCIERHVDANHLKTLEAAEQSEKELLHRSDRWGLSMTSTERIVAATWGDPPPPRRPKLTKWVPHRSGKLLGFASVQLASGMILHDLRVMTGKNGLWVAMPAQKQFDREGQPRLDGNGKAIYSQIAEFVDWVTADRFGAMVLELVQRARPDDLAGDSP